MLHVKSAMGILHDQTPWNGVSNTSGHGTHTGAQGDAPRQGYFVSN